MFCLVVTAAQAETDRLVDMVRRERERVADGLPPEALKSGPLQKLGGRTKDCRFQRLQKTAFCMRDVLPWELQCARVCDFLPSLLSHLSVAVDSQSASCQIFNADV